MGIVASESLVARREPHLYSQTHIGAVLISAQRAPPRKYAHGTVASAALFSLSLEFKTCSQPAKLTLPCRAKNPLFFNFHLLPCFAAAGGDGVLKGRHATNYIVMAAWAGERE